MKFSTTRWTALGAGLTLVVATLGGASALSSHAGQEWAGRMTADTAPVTDSAGNVWDARSWTLGSAKLSTRLVGQDVAGTTEDRLYQKNAWGITGYTKAVPASGTYRVRLLLAEDTFTSAGQRVFDVTAEGRPAVAGIDVAKAVGKGTAHDVVFDVAVTDGELNLGFVKRVDEPMVAAIEIRPAPATADADHLPFRMTSRPTNYTAAGVVWRSAIGFVGPARTSTALVGQPIGSTTNDELYQVQTWGMTGWRLALPEAGRYSVWILTTEGRWSGVGQRVFDVTAEGQTRLADVDIYKAAGYRTAYAPTFDVEVTDGTLDLGFVAKVDQPSISSIVVKKWVPAGPTTPTPTPTATTDGGGDGGTGTQGPSGIFTSRMVARPQPLTDSSGNVWARRSATLGSWSQSTRLVGKDVTGTTEDALYQMNIWGVWGYSVPVPAPATYRVRLLMAEDSFDVAGKRVFDVKAEGETVAAGIDIARAVGKGAAYDVTFEVPVSDGDLTLDFVRKTDLPLVSAIEVVSTTPVPALSTAPQQTVKLGADSYYTSSIASAPLAPNSSAVASWLAQQVWSRYGGVAAFNAYHFNAGFHVVPANQPKVTVDYTCSGVTKPAVRNLYDGHGHFLDVPVPSDAVAARGTDGQMTIYDPANDKLWEFWQMQQNTATGRWSACWGGRMDRVSSQQGIFASGFGTSASGLPMAPGMVSFDDIRRGRIDHAIAIAVPDPAAKEFSWPANRTDGTSSNPAAVMEGQRLRLDPSADLDAYDLSPIGRMIAEAAQRYGFIVIDNGGAVAVMAESGALGAEMTGTDPWRKLVGSRDYEVLRNFPWAKIQVLPKNYGAPPAY